MKFGMTFGTKNNYICHNDNVTMVNVFMSFAIMALTIVPFCIMTFITTLRIVVLFATLSIASFSMECRGTIIQHDSISYIT
jgi:hypothetical protein